MIKTMEQAIELVYFSYNQASKEGKGNIKRIQLFSRQLLNAVGHPDLNKRIILVAGSKGKGSTAMLISSLLSALSFKTGLFTSPHQFSFNERIQVNGESISDADFIRLANEVSPHVHELIYELAKDEYLGPIAVNLAIALLYFSEHDVDYIILEIGKGGLYDDTNVVENHWAVITPIMEEHIEELGPTISEIVKHKIGIIKSDNTAVIISKQQHEITELINKQLPTKTPNHCYYGEDYQLLQSSFVPFGMTFNLKTKQTTYLNLNVPLLGTFQCENIATAIQACEEITNEMIDERPLRTWLQSLKNPGKSEIISHQPTVLADATINRNSAVYLQEVVESFHPSHVITILGLSNDKDYKGVIRSIKEFSHKIIITKPLNGYKSFCEEQIAEYAAAFLPVEVFESAEDAFSYAFHKDDSYLLLILGNHSFIAEARLWFKENVLLNIT